MLGTTRFLTDSSGGQIEPAVYTAFGEFVSGTSGRFGYIGAHGYQTSDEMPYQHVGARYYDPTSGRFLQRDPIGIGDDLNVYAYVAGASTSRIDPEGLGDRECWKPGGPCYKAYWTDEQWAEVEKAGKRAADRQRREHEHPETYDYRDMRLDLHWERVKVKSAKVAMACLGGTWAIATKSIVGAVSGLASAIAALW